MYLLVDNELKYIESRLIETFNIQRYCDIAGL